MMTLQLVLTVTYNTNGTPKRELVDLLHRIAVEAAGRGALSGETPAEVEAWQARVDRRL